jgi:glycosyltransferase involved in cell wall biosynthesis
LAQTHAASEIIVVDDGSKDGTPEVLAGFGDRIRVIRQPNGGLSAARNTGILAARCEWIAFLDDDDEYAPMRLERAATGIRQHPGVESHLTNTAIVVAGSPDLDLFALRGIPTGPWLNVERPLPLVLKGCFFAQSLVVRRETLRAVGLFRPTFYEDMDLFIRLAARPPWIVDQYPALRLIRRGNTPAMSDDWRSKPLERCGALVRIHRECLAQPGLTSDEVGLVRNGLATYLFELGIAELRGGSDREARTHFAEAARNFRSPKARAKALCARFGGRPAVGLIERLTRGRKGFVR